MIGYDREYTPFAFSCRLTNMRHIKDPIHHHTIHIPNHILQDMDVPGIVLDGIDTIGGCLGYNQLLSIT